jgi:hypothetical protein
MKKNLKHLRDIKSEKKKDLLYSWIRFKIICYFSLNQP